MERKVGFQRWLKRKLSHFSMREDIRGEKIVTKCRFGFFPLQRPLAPNSKRGEIGATFTYP